MAEPTRGPWRVIHPILEGGSLNVVQSRHTVTRQKVIARVEDQSRRADTEANARLIASSPELLSSLEALIKGIDEWNEAVQQIIGKVPNYQWGALDEAKRVAAKARGESR